MWKICGNICICLFMNGSTLTSSEFRACGPSAAQLPHPQTAPGTARGREAETRPECRISDDWDCFRC